jgi:hypothetical protein
VKRSQTKKIILTIVSLSFIALLPNVGMHTAHAVSLSSTGVIIPLYGYPSADWNTLVQVHLANPGVPMIAVVNPSNGPGWWVDPNYVTGIAMLKAAGIKVVGYIYTSYAWRNIGSAETEISNYANWYGVNGIYMDEMSNIAGYEWYYSTLTQYAKGLGMSTSIGNPGADVPPSYLYTADTIVIYENAGLPSVWSLGGWHANYWKNNFGVVAYNVGWLDSSYLQSASSYLGWIYLTNGAWPNPYVSISSYLWTLVADLSTQGGGGGGSGGSSTISVSTVNTWGGTMWGYYVTLWQNGNMLGSCFSPCSFSVSPGLSYQVAVADYGSSSFSQWSDGTWSRFYWTSAPGSGGTTTLTAVYGSS